MQVELLVASGDIQEKAEIESKEEGWTFPIGFGLTVGQMRELGLYISSPRSDQETDRPFPEPGLFLTTPEGKLQLIDISNAPFSRPDLAQIVNGLRIIQEKSYPIRGIQV